MPSRRLSIVGTGISVGQISLESRTLIQASDFVCFIVSDEATASYIRELNPKTFDLATLYRKGVPRDRIYEEMADRIVAYCDEYNDVCAVFYGHPGVFVTPSHRAIKKARAKGIQARMYPGISAEDCLFADLDIDPGLGCQTYEATWFWKNRIKPDRRVLLIIWQVPVAGQMEWEPGKPHPDAIAYIRDAILESHGDDTEAFIYTASRIPLGKPEIQTIKVRDLAAAKMNPISTMCVLPRP